MYLGTREGGKVTRRLTHRLKMSGAGPRPFIKAKDNERAEVVPKAEDDEADEVASKAKDDEDDDPVYLGTRGGGKVNHRLILTNRLILTHPPHNAWGRPSAVRQGRR